MSCRRCQYFQSSEVIADYVLAPYISPEDRRSHDNPGDHGGSLEWFEPRQGEWWVLSLGRVIAQVVTWSLGLLVILVGLYVFWSLFSPA